MEEVGSKTACFHGSESESRSLTGPGGFKLPGDDHMVASLWGFIEVELCEDQIQALFAFLQSPPLMNALKLATCEGET